MDKLQTRGFHHTTMVARDADRTVRFYRDTLGIPLLRMAADDPDEPGAQHLYFGTENGAPGTLLTFIVQANAPAGRPGAGGVHHVALVVDTGEDQLRWKRRLTDAGVHVTGPLHRGYFQSIYFRDPDGQILEIATAGPGYAIDEPADALGKKVLQPPIRAELRGSRDEAEITARIYPEPVEEIVPSMSLRGIHHVTALTNDIVQAQEFYEQALGLRLIKQTVNQDDLTTPHLFWASYDGSVIAPHSALTLFAWPANAIRVHGGAGQTHRIAFRASSDDEQQHWLDHLRSLGIAVTPVQDRYFRSIAFTAPDGLNVEIATDGPGFRSGDVS
jgi:glyoxalase family protein